MWCCVMCLGGERESTGIALARTHCPLDSRQKDIFIFVIIGP